MTSRLSHLGRDAMRFAVIVSALAGLAVYVSWAYARVHPVDAALAERWRPSYRIAFGSSKSSIASMFIYGPGGSNEFIGDHPAVDPIFSEYARLSVQFASGRADPREDVPPFPPAVGDAPFPVGRLDPFGAVLVSGLTPGEAAEQHHLAGHAFDATSVWSSRPFPRSEQYVIPEYAFFAVPSRFARPAVEVRNLGDYPLPEGYVLPTPDQAGPAARKSPHSTADPR